MATPVSGMRTARDLLDGVTGSNASNEVDFQLAELSVGVQLLGVMGYPIAQAVNDTSNSFMVGTLNYGSNPVDPHGTNPGTLVSEEEIDQDIFYEQLLTTVLDTTNGGTTYQVTPSGLWVPPEPVLLVRNVTHRVEQGANVTGGHLVYLYYRYVRLSRDEQLMLFGRGT